jgi:heme/copper-type cytochrome/quinol oxidase subunit 3
MGCMCSVIGMGMLGVSLGYMVKGYESKGGLEMAILYWHMVDV